MMRSSSFFALLKPLNGWRLCGGEYEPRIVVAAGRLLAERLANGRLRPDMVTGAEALERARMHASP